MASFFEKLKRGMGVEVAEEAEETEETGKIEEEIEKKPKKITKTKKTKKVEMKTEPIEKTGEVEESTEPKEKPFRAEKGEGKEKLFGGPVGQLAVDVYQTEENLVIQSTVAGVKPEELDISIEDDVVVIKGIRERPAQDSEINYFYQECYWGAFSREIILPCEVDPSRVTATMKEGVLNIEIPKIEREKKRKIIVKG